MDPSFELLWWRLLLQKLDEIPGTELHRCVIAEAEAAALLARAFGFPLLLFPCLFAERTEVLLREYRVSIGIYWGTLAASVDRHPALVSKLS